MESVHKYNIDILRSYDKKLKIDSGIKVCCFSKKKLNKNSSGNNQLFVGEYIKKSREKPNAKFKVEDEELPLYKYKQHKRLFIREKGYVKCLNEKNKYIVLLKRDYSLLLLLLLLLLCCLLPFLKKNLPKPTPQKEQIGTVLNQDADETTGLFDNNPNDNGVTETSTKIRDTHLPDNTGSKEPHGYMPDPAVDRKYSTDHIDVFARQDTVISAKMRDIYFPVSNPASNKCYSVVKLYLLPENRKIAETGSIAPGQTIETLSLINGGMAPGKYQVNLTEEHYDKDTKNKLSTSNFRFTLTAR